MKKLSAKASIQVNKSIDIVFKAIVDPRYMSNYFIAKSTGKLEEEVTVKWQFPEFDEEFAVTGKKIIPNELISFDWSGGIAGQLVEIKLSSFNAATVIKIEEFEMNNDDEGIAIMMRQTEGWANFLACLKAYLEHGINLRKGAFDFMF